MLETLTILGGGGWFPARGRQTACALLRDGDSAIMIDAGPGVGRLVEQPELLAGTTRLDIVLTHFHLDHVTGLAYLPAIAACEEMIVWGPGRMLYDTPTHEIIARLSHQPLHPIPLEAQEIEVRDLCGTERARRGADGPAAPGPSLSADARLRFDDALTWITDTACDEDSARFAAGCGAVAHEAWFTSAQPRNPPIHSSASQAADVARQTEVERLLLIHLPPFAPSLHGLAIGAQSSGAAHTLTADDGTDVSALLA